MQRVLIVSNLFPPHVVGGAEVVAQRQARALAARGYDVVVFAGRFTQEERELGALSIEVDEGFPVYRVAIAEPSDPGRNFFRPNEERRFISVLTARTSFRRPSPSAAKWLSPCTTTGPPA